jgi:hypothetical protein
VSSIPRHKGIDADGIARAEADHFMKCPGCGEWFDMRDLGQVLAHIHDAEIEQGEGLVQSHAN